MAYQVLARKYRPSSFKSLIGQEILVRTISNSVINNRIAHAFLLSGIRGIGKTTSARIIAKTINCTDPLIQDGLVEPCGVCKNCTIFAEGKHPDILEMDAASRTGVNDIREIIENCKYRPVLGKYKFFIIDEVHMLSTSAFNALLKTLEEPPEHTKFIFATTEIQKIPTTILSRCQRFDLRRIDEQSLAIYLQHILEQEKLEASLDALMKIAQIAEGSVRDALSILDHGLLCAAGQKMELKTVNTVLGFRDQAKIAELFHLIVSGKTVDSLNLIKELYLTGADIVLLFEELLAICLKITKAKIGATQLLSDLDQKDLVEVLAQKLSMAALTSLWQMLMKALQEMQFANNHLSAAEMIIVRLCYMSSLQSEDAPANKTESPKILKAQEETPGVLDEIMKQFPTATK